MKANEIEIGKEYAVGGAGVTRWRRLDRAIPRERLPNGTYQVDFFSAYFDGKAPPQKRTLGAGHFRSTWDAELRRIAMKDEEQKRSDERAAATDALCDRLNAWLGQVAGITDEGARRTRPETAWISAGALRAIVEALYAKEGGS